MVHNNLGYPGESHRVVFLDFLGLVFHFYLHRIKKP